MSTATPPQDGHRTPSRVLVGRTLQMMRKNHGISLRELAGLVGSSASHLNRVEQGKRSPSPELYERVLDALAALPAKEAS